MPLAKPRTIKRSERRKLREGFRREHAGKFFAENLRATNHDVAPCLVKCERAQRVFHVCTLRREGVCRGTVYTRWEFHSTQRGHISPNIEEGQVNRGGVIEPPFFRGGNRHELFAKPIEYPRAVDVHASHSDSGISVICSQWVITPEQVVSNASLAALSPALPEVARPSCDASWRLSDHTPGRAQTSNLFRF